MSIMRNVVAVSVFSLVVGAAGFVQAGGPLSVCRSGQPHLWANGGRDIVFNPDQGALGPLSQEQGVSLVQRAFDQWSDVSTSTASFTAGPPLPVDVDISNFAPYLDPVEPDGLSAIVFDDTGEIFDALFGPDSGILGFAGPEFLDNDSCEIIEGASFLNGPTFTDEIVAMAVMVHEFGHFANLAHTQTNGAFFLGDTTGPTPYNTFDGVEPVQVETMYPFFFGPEFEIDTPQLDDRATLSRLYPQPDFAATTGVISGSVLAPNGTTPVTGVNVIARNVADPIGDAVSAISGDFSVSGAAGDPVAGTFRLVGLTPGAEYVVFMDQIVDGGYSTTPLQPLPGPEEFWNGADESANGTTDDPAAAEALLAVAGQERGDVNFVFNAPAPGENLPIGDDDALEIFLPFAFNFCGQSYDSLFINSNGSVSFGAGDTSFLESTSSYLAGVPRIAGLWTDLNPIAGGAVTFEQSDEEFRVKFENVPTFGSDNQNTFSIVLHRGGVLGHIFGPLFGNRFDIEYGDVGATRALAGYSCGSQFTSGFESESDLSEAEGRIHTAFRAATFEQFVPGSGEVVDLAGTTIGFDGVGKFFDMLELVRDNNSIDHSVPVLFTPFNTASIYTSIDPSGDDVDYYTAHVKAGDFVAIEVVRGSLDSLLGVFNADTGELLVSDDDGGDGLLSRVLFQAEQDLRIAVAVTTFPDTDFTGAGGSGGRYVLYMNRYRGEPVALLDDDTVEVPLDGFSVPFQDQEWESVFINSNGSISFGAGDPGPFPSVQRFLDGPARVAPLWDDLDPSSGSAGLVLAEQTHHGIRVHFVSVPEFFGSSPNYVTASVSRRGRVSFEWGPTVRGPALVGVTEGGGVEDPGSTDLSVSRGLSAHGTTYQEFSSENTSLTPSDFDLFFDTVRFR